MLIVSIVFLIISLIIYLIHRIAKNVYAEMLRNEPKRNAYNTSVMYEYRRRLDLIGLIEDFTKLPAYGTLILGIVFMLCFILVEIII